MKQIVRAVSLVLLPILLYYAVFIAFEPNNYFGLREAPLREDDIIAAMRIYEDAPTNGVVVGDSRLANLDAEMLSQALGVEYTNLAYGGASLGDALDMVEWLTEQNPGLSQIVLGMSFYTLSAGAPDRTVVEAMRNPFVYMTNLTYNISMLETVGLLLKNAWLEAKGEEPLALGGGEAETRNPAEYVYVTETDPVTGETFRVREDLVQYIVERANLIERGENWKLDGELLARMAAILRLCEEKGIDVIVVLPPMDDSVRRLVIAPNTIEGPMAGAVDVIRQTGAVVLDYEFSAAPDYGDDMFYDGFHLDHKNGLPVWEQTLISDIQAARRTAA